MNGSQAYSYTQVLELLEPVPRSEGGLETRSHRASLSRYYKTRHARMA